MCGIAGILDPEKRSENEQLVSKMLAALEHRGPDGFDHWKNSENNVVLGHRRLAIIELNDDGKQPMHLSNEFTITFNGEVYNYIELRNELKTLGHSFKTSTDTEVLLIAYKQWGIDCLKKIDGMFAFCLLDHSKQKAFSQETVLAKSLCFILFMTGSCCFLQK